MTVHSTRIIGAHNCTTPALVWCGVGWLAADMSLFQTVFANLIKQCARRKLEELGGLAAVPRSPLQSAADQVCLQRPLRALHRKVVGIEKRWRRRLRFRAAHRLGQGVG